MSFRFKNGESGVHIAKGLEREPQRAVVSDPVVIRCKEGLAAGS